MNTNGLTLEPCLEMTGQLASVAKCATNRAKYPSSFVLASTAHIKKKSKRTTKPAPSKNNVNPRASSALSATSSISSATPTTAATATLPVRSTSATSSISSATPTTASVV